jgi:mono/diheme cytochrome c family protein
MKRSAVVFLIVALPQSLSAQPFPAGGSLNATQKLGRDLFTQHCMVCHEHTQINMAPHFGPDISSQSLGGQDKALFDQISNGSPNMPGFKYVFNPQQIQAIVAYVKSLPAPPSPPAPGTARAAPRDEKPSQGDRHDD